ncbi:MAG: lamin tail domain-containing protein [Anaerolineales bacterium]|jgi:hypothetical protein
MKLNNKHLSVIVLLAVVLSWKPASAASKTLIITRFVYRSTMEPPMIYGEYMVIKNISDGPIDLSAYRVGDEETQGGMEGMFFLPSYTLTPGASVIIAGDPDTWNYPTEPNFYFTSLTPDSSWGSGSFTLSDKGDEVLLIDASGNLVDGACYGGVACIFEGATQAAILNSALEMDINLPGFKRINDTDTDLASDWQTNPTPVELVSLAVHNRPAKGWHATLGIMGILCLASLLILARNR